MRSDAAELRARIGTRGVLASVSGGKDSAAMCLLLEELGIPYERVFLDTGWEHPMTYEYLRGPLTQAIGPIWEIKASSEVDVPLERLRPRVRQALEAGSAMVAQIIRKGMFPSKRRRFCTQTTKAYVIKALIRALQDAGAEVINTLGIRAEESEARALMTEWEWSNDLDCEVWRPVIDFSEQEVIEIHRRHGLRPNPLYLQNASRVGCWPCIYARKEEIRHIADSDPERIALLRDLEADVTMLAEERYAAEGETFDSLGYHEPSWFQAPLGDSGERWPIDKVVAWSKTLHGGKVEDKQVELFAGVGINDGCMRWGLCEAVKRSKKG